MIRGRVTADREAIFRLAVKGRELETREIEGVIDTGFNGFLTLPGSAVHALGLPLVGNRRATLADGSVAILDAHMATVLWGGQTREVLVLKADGAPLIGMALLNGHRIIVDVVPGGPVVIEPLT